MAEVLDNHWMIRVIVTQPGNEPITDYVTCVIKDITSDTIPSEDRVVQTLKVARGYSKGTEFEVKGISAMLENEINKWPELF